MDNEERKRKDNVMDKIYPEYSSVDDAFEDGYNSCDKKWRELVQGRIDELEKERKTQNRVSFIQYYEWRIDELTNILASLDGGDKPK